MKIVLKTALLLLIASGVLVAQVMKPSDRTSSSVPSGNVTFSQLTDQFVKESLALSPVNASYAGFHKYTDPKTGKVIELDAELDDVSAKGIAAQEAFYRAWRARLQKETPVASLDAQDGVDYRLIDDNIALSR